MGEGHCHLILETAEPKVKKTKLLGCFYKATSTVLIGFLKTSCKMFSGSVLIDTSCTVFLSPVLLWFLTTMWF